MWDFILPNSNNENEQEALTVSTRSKSAVEPIQTSPKKKNSTPITKDKTLVKKNSPLPTQNQPSSCNSPSTSKTLVVSDSMDYNIIEDMKKTRANISLHELSKIKHQQNLLLKELNAVPASPLPNGVISKEAKRIR